MECFTISKASIQENVELFRCPVCGEKMISKDRNSIACTRQHSFDLARSGYINLLLKASKNEYDKRMLQSRKEISKAGFFDPLLGRIGELIAEKVQRDGLDRIRILDAGCGEGSHLACITENLQRRIDFVLPGVGIDISKDGIQMASKQYPGLIWCVADLARVPFLDHQFDFILNILSPSNYGEFHRVMNDDGTLIKVVPGSDYLLELRDALYDETGKKSYSNEKVIELFKDHFEVLNMEQVQYRINIDKQNFRHLVEMTPLSWGASSERLQEVLSQGIEKITVDYAVITGKKRIV